MSFNVSAHVSAGRFYKQCICLQASTVTKFNKIFLGCQLGKILLNIQHFFTWFIGKSPHRAVGCSWGTAGITVRPCVLCSRAALSVLCVPLRCVHRCLLLKLLRPDVKNRKECRKWGLSMDFTSLLRIKCVGVVCFDWKQKPLHLRSELH